MSETPGTDNPNVNDKIIIAVDSMIFIYHFDNHHLFGSNSHAILENYEKGFQLITSVVSVTETLSISWYQQYPEIQQKIQNYFNLAANLIVYPITINIAIEAAKLRRLFKPLRTPDALQLATAVIYKAGTFVTHDKRLKNFRLPLRIKVIGEK